MEDRVEPAKETCPLCGGSCRIIVRDSNASKRNRMQVGRYSDICWRCDGTGVVNPGEDPKKRQTVWTKTKDKTYRKPQGVW